MVLKGRVKQGVVVFESERVPPEDSVVEVHFDEKAALGEWSDKYAGCADDLPPDAAANFKHYLYGHQKT